MRFFPTIAVVFIGLATSVSARTIAVNQLNLPQTLEKAQPGDRLVMAAGGYGTVVIPARSWLKPITLDARKALLTGIVFKKASGVSVVGGTIIASVAYGVKITDSTRISIYGMDISGGPRGIVVATSDDIEIRKNKLHHLRSDGIDVVGKRVLIDGNTISDMQPIAGDHPDAIQLWSADDRTTSDVTIQNNVISGFTQGIFGRTPGLGLERIKVTNNRVTVSYPNALVLMDLRDGVVTSNVVKSPSAGKTSKANVRIIGLNNVACGNQVPDVPSAPAAKAC